MHILSGLHTSLIVRPYVFLFLLGFLFFTIRFWGIKKTFIWLLSGYAIAWLSEISSIHNGFPYGLYHYVYKNLQGELLVFGVPFFDSLSYVFLTFAGYGLAQRISKDNPYKEIFLGALFTMLLDIIIDPVATQGARWFLGEIHTYAYPGFYFGVPLTNFMGWYLVSAVIIAFNIFVNRGVLPKTNSGPVILYVGPALFQIGIAYSIGEYEMFMAGLAILAIVLRIVFTPKFEI